MVTPDTGAKRMRPSLPHVPVKPLPSCHAHRQDRVSRPDRRASTCHPRRTRGTGRPATRRPTLLPRCRPPVAHQRQTRIGARFEFAPAGAVATSASCDPSGEKKKKGVVAMRGTSSPRAVIPGMVRTFQGCLTVERPPRRRRRGATEPTPRRSRRRAHTTTTVVVVHSRARFPTVCAGDVRRANALLNPPKLVDQISRGLPACLRIFRETFAHDAIEGAAARGAVPCGSRRVGLEDGRNHAAWLVTVERAPARSPSRTARRRTRKMSLRASASLPSSCSGAMYCNVPTIVPSLGERRRRDVTATLRRRRDRPRQPSPARSRAASRPPS